MTGTFRAVALGVALTACPLAAADADVPLPIFEQMTGMQTLAPVLKGVTPAIVGIAVETRDGSARNLRAAHAAGQVRTEHQTPEHQRPEHHEHQPAEQAAPEDQPGTEPDGPEMPAGSGVIVNAGLGLIVTNDHVVKDAEDVTVKLYDGRELPAKVMGSDPQTDIAVLRVATDDLTDVPAGNSDRVEVGDFVVAIGDPFQIGQTVTSGIVSGLNRNNVGIEEVEDFIQTDAAIYPGNSGGALVNLRGELVGINTAYVGATNANPGMGFAIPINMVRRVIDRIVETGNVVRGRLGITFEDGSPALARELRFATVPASPVITKVEAGSVADRAGLKVGDQVTDLDGTRVRTMPQLRTRLGLLFVGDTAEFTVLHRGRPAPAPAVIRVTIAEPPAAVQ